MTNVIKPRSRMRRKSHVRFCRRVRRGTLSDLVIKMIFGDKRHPRILIHFLNSVIRPQSPITSIDIRQTELSKDLVSQKGVRLDIVATTESNEIISIEMQKGREPHMVARSLFYWSKLFSGQLEVSESYKNLHRTISINILDFKLFEQDKRFWRKAILLDKETNEQLTDLLELHFIELGKMKEMREDSPITFWIEFFKDPYSEKVKKLCEYVPEIKEAKEVYERAKSDPEAQELIRLREKGLRDYISGLENAHEEGREEGIAIGEERGIEQKTREAALNMKTDGLPDAIIAKYLGITEDELKKLLNA